MIYFSFSFLTIENRSVAFLLLAFDLSIFRWWRWIKRVYPFRSTRSAIIEVILATRTVSIRKKIFDQEKTFSSKTFSFRAFSVENGVVSNCDQSETKLLNELQRIKEDLKNKDNEIQRVYEMRENSDREIQDLTAFLFEVKRNRIRSFSSSSKTFLFRSSSVGAFNGRRSEIGSSDGRTKVKNRKWNG